MAQRLATAGSSLRTTASGRMRKVNCLGGQIERGKEQVAVVDSGLHQITSFGPYPGSTDNVAFSSTSGLQISMVGPTKYDNPTVRWRVSEYFGTKAPGMFICHLPPTSQVLVQLTFATPKQLLLHISLPLASIFALMQHFCPKS